MTYRRNIRLMLVLIAVMALPALGQQGRRETAAQGADCHSLESSVDAGFRATRVIVDPGTHQGWLLERNVSRPASPARLVPVSCDFSCRFRESGHGSALNQEQTQLPIVHAGDALILVERTRVSEARLEATALSSGSPGEAIKVRLKIGGHTLLAIPTAPGRAMLLTAEGEVRQ